MTNKPSEEQEIIELWKNDQIKQLKFQFKKFGRKSKVVTRAFLKTNWQHEMKKIKYAYQANKALYYGANKNIPYSTLILIGKCLMDEDIAHETKRAIKHNVIVLDGILIKLDDPKEQGRIRKAFRNKHFSNVQNYAA